MQNGYTYFLLRSLGQQQALVSIYCEPQDPEAFVFAYVEQVTARHVLMAAITPWGRLDGWWVRRTGDVFQVLYGEDYEQRMAFLLDFHHQQHQPLLPSTPAEDADLLHVVLSHAVAQGAIVTLMTAQESFPVLPLQVDSLRVTFRVLDLFGVPVEEGTMPLRDIEALSIGTEEEKMYALLREAYPAQEGLLN